MAPGAANTDELTAVTEPSVATEGSSGQTDQASAAATASGSPEAAAVAAAAAQEAEHPFETDPGDHAETPFEAYEHLDLLLTRLAKRLGTSKAALRVYDPYYCEGAMSRHMGRLGYESVYNRNEDFYAIKAAGRCPEYDVLVTNPPFSGDHLERIFRFAVNSDKPWCLLVPQYVARKAFFLEWLNNQRPRGAPKPSFLAPTRSPYVFTAPDRADVRGMRLSTQQEGSSSSPAAAASSNAAQAPAPEAGTTGLETPLSALGLHQEPAVHANGLQAAAAAAAADLKTAEAPAAAPAVSSAASPETPGAGTTSAPAAAAAAPRAFDVAAGSFQCVWFFSLGERHHKPVVEWLQQQLAQQQQQPTQQQLSQQQQQQQGSKAAAAAAGGCEGSAGPAFTVVGTIKEVPQLMAAPKLTPAERRWRKKMAAAGGQQPPEGDQQQQQQRQAGGRAAAGGRSSSGRPQQQQQPSGGRPGGRGRQQQQQQFGGRVGGRFGAMLQPGLGLQQPAAGERPAGGRVGGRQQQQQQQQPGRQAPL